ncbi:ATP-dependent Clp protease proteolytic subunit 1 [Bacillus phage vB_BhaS-171]|uniref:head maturation protease n=1 Tax=Bacillus phage vB_BhaS-171 TaxID=1775140 RepID=UPI000744BA5C|nr:head maturation protease [Bacillus phage vB_BhaS-171]ALY08064.1 ATP-dependent Clp protease proteolytic subunit 1 [Bacillus phage vB_BhaS-171]
MRRLTKEDFFKSFKNQSYIEQLKKVERKLETVRNETANTTEITIYGVIGDSWWDDSVSASDIDNALKSAEGDLIINLNSPGGDAFDGIAIYNRLKKHNGKVTINVDGWACSAASVIAMAADELIMGMGSMLMIHEASTIVWGTKKDMRKEADVLDNLEDGIIDIYMTKANVEREEIRRMVDDETWFSAQKALEIGFATSTGSNPEGAEVTNLKSKLSALEGELEQLKNQNKEDPTPEPVKNSGLSKLFLNLK